MSWLDLFLPMLPAACLTIAFVHALVWLRRRDSVWHLAFVASAIAVAGLTTIELQLMEARTAADYATTSRLLQVPLALLVASLVAFVRAGLGAGRAWLGTLAVGLRLAALVAGFTTGDNLYKSEVTGLSFVRAFGDELPLALGPANPWSVLGIAANLALLAFCIDTWFGTRGDSRARRRMGTSLAIGAIVAGVPLTLYLAGQLGASGWIATPLAFNLAFVPAIFAMGYELSVTIVASEQLESALRSSETRLAETLERNELAFAALGLALFSWDPVRGRLWASSRARAMFALPADGDVSFSDVFASVHPDDRDGLRESLADAMLARSAWDREFRIGDARGPSRWMSCHGSVHSSAEDGALLLHCVAADVTARHATAEELRRLEVEASQQRDELAHLARVSILSELSGSLAHELNQPLAAILGNAQAALRYLDRQPPDVDELREIVTDIVEADRRAGEVIKRLRSMLRKEGAHYVELDVNDVVEDALRLMRSDLLNRRVRVRWEPAAGLAHVAGDRVQLQQVLLNLVANAGDAMAEEPAGMREITIGTARSADGGVEVCVSDHGVGVAESELERMFDPFVTTKADGIGLGLSVCRSIMGAHHGRIWATRNLGPGCTFHFALPGIDGHAPPQARAG